MLKSSLCFLLACAIASATVCETGLFQYPAGVCTNACPMGTFPDVHQWLCVACHSTCKSCTDSGASACILCATGLWRWQGQCLAHCPSSTTPNVNTGGCDWTATGDGNGHRSDEGSGSMSSSRDDHSADHHHHSKKSRTHHSSKTHSHSTHSHSTHSSHSSAKSHKSDSGQSKKAAVQAVRNRLKQRLRRAV